MKANHLGMLFLSVLFSTIFQLPAQQSTTNLSGTNKIPAQQPVFTSNANAIRNQAISAWLSKVTTTSTTKSNGTVETSTTYHTNAVSQAEFAALKAKAESGDPVAQYLFGESCFWSGDIGAIQWLQKAAEQGLPEAQNELANWYIYYREKKDLTEGIKWLRKAAEQGNLDAQRKLGQFYRDGTGVPVDQHEAFIWYGKAAEQGHPEDQRELGQFYRFGTGTAVDEQKAFIWLAIFS